MWYPDSCIPDEEDCFMAFMEAFDHDHPYAYNGWSYTEGCFGIMESEHMDAIGFYLYAEMFHTEHLLQPPR